MEGCCLIKPGPADAGAVDALAKKWRAFGGRMHPGLLRAYEGDYGAFLKLLSDWEAGVGVGREAPQTLYLLKRGDGEILGAVALRHYLNETNLTDGGHVGYGVCPEYRGLGYGSEILRLALERLREMGVTRALVTCEETNALSRSVILHNGGTLENSTFDEDGVPIERYWIDI